MNIAVRLRGLIASIAIVVFTAGTPVLLLRIDAVPDFTQFTRDRLMMPDDGSLLLQVITALAWLFWGLWTISVAIAIPSQVRGLRAPRLPGLTLPQNAANNLVATAALLFITVPSAHSGAPAANTYVPVATAAAEVDPSPETVSSPVRTASALTKSYEASGPPHGTTKHYQVKRGDSLWKIAQTHLGRGSRYTEIVELNREVLATQPDWLIAGTDLLIPVDEAPEVEVQETATYVVEPGDTLSEIAETELGDADAYPRIVEASEDTVQRDGRQLTDPDLIVTGWKLTIPGQAPSLTPDEGARPAPVPSPPRQPPPMTAPGVTPSGPTSSPAPTNRQPVATHPSEEAGAQRGSDAVDTDAEVTPGWLLPGLAGAGTVLAGSLLLVLRQLRRTQMRHRRPGHMIAPPPRELRPVAKSIHLVGNTGATYVTDLDRTLRTLSVDSAPPDLVSAEVADGSVTLHLADPVDKLPWPWHGEGTTWSAPLDSDVTVDDQRPAYPLLVAVGRDDDDRDWLVNLEQLQEIVITGDRDRAMDFATYVAAELAINPWSCLARVDLLGIGAELDGLSPDRLHSHADDDVVFLDWLASELDPTAAVDRDLGPDRFRVVLTTANHAETVRPVSEIIAEHPGRPGAAVVLVDPERDGAHGAVCVLEVGIDGRLRALTLDLDIHAAGLSPDEAKACAAIVDATRATTNEPIPATAEPTTVTESLTDSAGAVRSDLVDSRPADLTEPAGNEAVLAGPTAAYVEASATTAEDVATEAPLVPAAVSRELIDGDAHLDRDRHRWNDPDARVPKLVLLGPLNARAPGERPPDRKPYYVEVLAYLVIHPEGVTTDQIQDAFHIRPARIYTVLAMLRAWLGTNPDTGEPYLPNAQKSAQADGGAKAIYRVRGVLCDLDLFRRLRARAQARGADGIGDLTAALDLVTGAPFSNQRDNGWAWLLDDAIDHIAQCAIVDVAHTVIDHALTTGDHDLARRTAEAVIKAVPADETARLDLIKVAATTGHVTLAAQQLVDEIYNRSDDDLGPIELPERAREIVDRHLRHLAHRRQAG
ncbi:putative LysM domain protein [Nocardioidaceae bacterium Broad-1]|nr:putative LysM domain protein [Nocardioidaceae bacterium Broad-1]